MNGGCHIDMRDNVRTNSVMINGGKRLKGKVSVQGSKNSTLPILAASLLTDKKVTLRNVPEIDDILSMLEILNYLGARHTFKNNVLEIDNSEIQNKEIPDEMSKKLRASSLLLGPLLARFGKCSVGMPGGCSIGPRPLNIHFDGFKHLGSEIVVEEGFMVAKADGVQGEYTLEFPSVGATQNLINASVFAKGKTILRNVSIEPEVMALINFLKTMGANIEFIDQTSIEIVGVEELRGSEFQIPFDRIEAGTLLVAAFATKGEVTIKGVSPKDMTAVLQKLKDMGAFLDTSVENEITLKYKGVFNPVSIRTGVHPAFPTDMQSQFSVLLTRANESSVITETIFNNRFRHLQEMLKLNAELVIEKDMAVIFPSELSGCTVQGYDLRGAASMIIAGLIAKGSTRVNGLENLYRGYEAFVEKLEHLGAELYYIDETLAQDRKLG